jgi:hypothetical protein
VVAIVVDAPDDVDFCACGVGCHWSRAPVAAWLVVVNADPGVVAAWSAAANGGSVEVRPGFDGFEDGAFGAGINSSLEFCQMGEVEGNRLGARYLIALAGSACGFIQVTMTGDAGRECERDK